MSRVQIATKLNKLNTRYDEWDPRKRVIAYAETVFTKPDNLYLIYSQKNTGINRFGGKRWWRWENSSIQGLKRNKNGNIVAYTVVGKKNTTTSSVWALLESSRYPEKEVKIVFRQYAKDMFGVTHWHDVYPVAKYYNIPQYYMAPPTVIGALRATNSRDFVERLFGKRQYRKDLLKAVGNSNTVYPLHIAKAFRGLVPTDWIVNFLNLNHQVDTGYDQGYCISIYTDIRPLLTALDPRSYRRLLLEPMTANKLYGIEDIARMFNQRGLGDADNYFRSWADAHDRLINRYNYHLHTPFEDSEISLHPIAEKIHGLRTKSFEIVTATHTKELEEWGSAMHNCIGGYKRMAANNETILGAIYSRDKLVANYEISATGNLKQLLGPCNKPLSNSQRTELEAAFKSKGVKVQGYWGRNNELF